MLWGVILVGLHVATSGDTILASRDDSPYIALPSGATVKGTIRNGIPVYLGIEYATAGRFEVPKLLPFPLDQVTEATAVGPICFQIREPFVSSEGEERCLFLNVLTPVATAPVKRAVMVYLHGGCMQSGSGMDLDYNGFGKLVEEGDVIVVTINYRVNLFGFFTSSNESAPKNFGLRDQIVALQWVQTNIEHFGGDPDRVTIFGESAGGLSVLALYQSPLAAGLFHRAISQSPGFQTVGQFQRSWKDAAESMWLSCMQKNDCDTVDCLRTKPASDLTQKCREVFVCGTDYLTKVGSIFAGFDGEVVQKPVQAASCEQEVIEGADKPLMIGSNAHEWRFFASYDAFMPGCNDAYRPAGVEHVFLQHFLQGYASSHVKVKRCAIKKLHHLYASSSNPETCSICALVPDVSNAALLELVSDISFTIGAQLLAAQPGGPRYRYFFDLGDAASSLGTMHSLDVCYVSESEVQAGSCSQLGVAGPQYEVVARMMRAYWSSFAKTGVPTSTEGPQWSPVDPGSGLLGLPLLHMQLGSTAMSNSAPVSNATAAVLSNIVCNKVELKSTNDSHHCDFVELASTEIAAVEEQASADRHAPLVSVIVFVAIVYLSAYVCITCARHRMKKEYTDQASFHLLESQLES